MPICGIEVRLPVGLKPYPSQKLMMVRIITALTKRLNLLAESPTGSGTMFMLFNSESWGWNTFVLGKTMALLASSCAWIVDYKRKRCESTSTCPVHSYRNKTAAPSGMFSKAFDFLAFTAVHHALSVMMLVSLK